MRIKKLSLLIIPILILTMFNPVLADEGNNYSLVFVEPVNQDIFVNESFIVNISCVPTEPIKAFEFKLYFDPMILTANNISLGNIFSNYTIFFNPGEIDNINGSILDVYGLILGPGNVTTPGCFAQISFTAKESIGTSFLNLTDVGVSNETEYIQIDVLCGYVTVVENNNPPVFSDANPKNESINIPVNYDNLSIHISDPDGDFINWSISTNPDIGISNGISEYNGTKICTITSLDYNNTYYWHVFASDGETWVNKTFYFQTKISRYDLNNDSIVDFKDAGLCWTFRDGNKPYDPFFDVNSDDIIDYRDAGLVWTNRD